LPRAGRPTHRENETGQNHRQAASMMTAARTRATRVTQPSFTQITAASANTPEASGCRAISRASQPSSRASFTSRMMPSGVR
jgi:hypothetical protein